MYCRAAFLSPFYFCEQSTHVIVFHGAEIQLTAKITKWAPEIVMKGSFKTVVIRGVNPSVPLQPDGSVPTYRSSEIMHVVSPARVLCRGGNMLDLTTQKFGVDLKMAKKVLFPRTTD